VVAFWDRTAANQVLARHQADAESAWHARMVGYLIDAVAAQELHERTPVTSVADIISSICLGQQVE